MSMDFSSLPAEDWVDIACATVTLLSVGLSAWRGLSFELPIGVGWLCGALAAWYAYAPIHRFYAGLSALQDQPEFLFLATAISAALLAGGVAALVSRLLRLIAVRVGKTGADHVLGAVVGLGRAFFLLLTATAALLIQSWWKSGQEIFCDRSQTGQLFTPLAARVLALVHQVHPHFEIHRLPNDLGDRSPYTPPASR